MENRKIDKIIIFAVIIIELICVVGASYLKISPAHINNFEIVLQNVLTIVSILLGFIFALIGIFIGLINEKVIRKLKESNLASRLILYISFALVNGFISTVLSIIMGSMVDLEGYNIFSIIVFNLWCCSNLFFLVFSSILMTILMLVLKDLIVDNKPSIKGVNPNVENMRI